MPHHSTLTALLVTLISLPIQGQLLWSAPAEERDASLDWSNCDNGYAVDFESTPSGPLSYYCVASIETGEDQVLGWIWSWYDGEFGQDWNSVFTHTFSAPGEHLVCLTVYTLDQVTLEPCTTVTCHFLDVLQDSSCAGLSPDFTITGLDGQTVTFGDLSSFNDSIVDLFWDFGDGMALAGSSASHTFTGPGPHQVCMRVIGPPPVECQAGVCKWLYLGPGDVDCGTVLEPDFILLQYEHVVCVLDSSITSGMARSVSWDFGDGTTGEGQLGLHGYAPGPDPELCLTVRTWGPLVSDTCEATLCRTVELGQVTAIEETVSGQALRAWPVPFRDRLRVDGLEEGPVEVVVHDALGRPVFMQGHASGKALLLDLGGLPSGMYLLRCRQAGSLRTLRVLKE